jgi:hypothetical protein
VYVAPAVIGTGVENVTVCHPVAVSPVKVARASSCPVLDHKEPTWVPLLPLPL